MSYYISGLVNAAYRVAGMACVFIICAMITGAWLQLDLTLFAEMNAPLAWVIYGVILGTVVGHELQEIYYGGVVFSAVVAILAIAMGQLEVLVVAAVPWIAVWIYRYLQSQ